jgi:hypothetical protein
MKIVRQTEKSYFDEYGNRYGKDEVGHGVSRLFPSEAKATAAYIKQVKEDAVEMVQEAMAYLDPDVNADPVAVSISIGRRDRAKTKAKGTKSRTR